MATRMAVMYLGEIVEAGAAHDILSAPRHPYTRALLASALTITPGAGIPESLVGSSYPNPLDPPSGCKLHPRCPEALPACSHVSPPVVGEGEDFVRCHLHAREADRAA